MGIWGFSPGPSPSTGSSSYRAAKDLTPFPRTLQTDWWGLGSHLLLLCFSSETAMTMLCLKKYFTEGLIQVAILLSLCGVRVDVGLEPYLPPSLQEMILGQTSALTQTQFHNLRNHLEDGHGLHPKNVDLDGFFTTRRLLGWVRSLDRLQVGDRSGSAFSWTLTFRCNSKL